MDTKYLKTTRQNGRHIFLKQKYRQGHNLTKKDFTCSNPLRSLTIDRNGEVFICTCEGHLPYPVGHILDFNSMYDIWNNSVARKLQENTRLGSTFKFCDTSSCAYNNIENDSGVYLFNISLDQSCNLQCPSCRLDMIFHKEGKQFNNIKKHMDKFISLLDEFDEPAVIELAGGEPFASKIYSDVLYDYIPNKIHLFTIRTNATLINEERIKQSVLCKRENLQLFSVSIDAGSEEVYNIVRPPGRWDSVIKSLNFLKNNNFFFVLTFVVQKNNFKDIPNFIDLCEKHNVDGYMSPVTDWGTWSYPDVTKFNEHQVFMPNNELYNEWLEVFSLYKTHSYAGRVHCTSDLLIPPNEINTNYYANNLNWNYAWNPVLSKWVTYE